MKKSEAAITGKYWQLVRLEATGKSIIQEIIAAQEFLYQQFPELHREIKINHRLLQQQLCQLLKAEVDQLTAKSSKMAQVCLRCFISWQIERVCIQLEVQFGREYGFNRSDLFLLVLNDTLDDLRHRDHLQNYKPLSIEILDSFEPQKSNLSTWTTTIVKHNRELNDFLLEQGIYLISDWAILNDTTPKQVAKILGEFHNLTTAEINRASELLLSYHYIYRQDRLQQRALLGRKCQPPSVEQLERIATELNNNFNSTFSGENVLSQLQQLAQWLREYRIHVRSGRLLKHKSLDNDNIDQNQLEQSLMQTETDDESEQEEFSEFYRQQIVSCLQDAIALVIKIRVDQLSRKKSQKAKQFLIALELFHCQGKSMGQIAPLVELKAQYQVTRLLKLKELRADIRQEMLAKLREQTLAKASQYAEMNQLKQVETQIETILDEQIKEIIEKAEIEANTASNTSPTSLLNSSICDHLQAQ